MSWDAKDVALLKKLWAVGQSAPQIARRLGCSRNAVCGRLTRLGLKRGHKSPTAKPKIRPVPKRNRRGRIRRAAEKGCKCPDVPDIVVVRLLDEVAHRHVFDHAPAQRADGLLAHWELLS